MELHIVYLLLTLECGHVNGCWFKEEIFATAKACNEKLPKAREDDPQLRRATCLPIVLGVTEK